MFRIFLIKSLPNMEWTKLLDDRQITHLDLSVDCIFDEGAQMVAEALPGSKITHLYLHNNYIGDEGARMIVEVLPDSQITHLDMQYNNIVYEDVLEEALVDGRQAVYQAFASRVSQDINYLLKSS